MRSDPDVIPRHDANGPGDLDHASGSGGSGDLAALAEPAATATATAATTTTTTTTATTTGAGVTAEAVAAALATCRDRSLRYTSLDDIELIRQHSPLMSPLVWDLAHVGNYEELWLLRALTGAPELRPGIDSLYDAFRHPRATRSTLPLLSPAQSRAYLAEVRNRVLDTLDTLDRLGADAFGPAPGGATRDRRERLLAGGFVFGLVVQHEHQHDETMLATHQLRAGPPLVDDGVAPPPGRPVPAREVLVPAGDFTMGTSHEPWAYDNERPAHRVYLPAFWIDTLPVSNAAHIAFIEAGGYDDERLWSARGWQWRCEQQLSAPLFWWRDSGVWVRRRFGRFEPVPPNEPVQHVCWYEAQAHACWAGRRLPTEAEWEKACAHDPASGRSRRFPWGDGEATPARANLGHTSARPAPLGAYPAGASAYGAEQMIGDVWEWTASDFTGYPGFSVFPYPEYSEVFFPPATWAAARPGGGASDSTHGVPPPGSAATFPPATWAAARPRGGASESTHGVPSPGSAATFPLGAGAVAGAGGPGGDGGPGATGGVGGPGGPGGTGGVSDQVAGPRHDQFKVLRGGSWATHPAAVRSTFRNWDYPIRRQIFAGFRLARDADRDARWDADRDDASRAAARPRPRPTD